MTAIHQHLNSVTAYAPATCANVAVGFDILGFALDTVGDTVTLTKRDDHQFIIETANADLPIEADKNTASYVVKKLCQDLQLNIGFSFQIQKGIALGSGMGGSAASAVAALVAFNAFLKQPLSIHELARYALLGEELASGAKHADNIVPCLFGGLTLICATQPLEILSLPIPELFCILIHPYLRLDTKEARGVLKRELPLTAYVKQSAYLASFIAALYQHDENLLKKSMVDVLIEPQRAPLIPHFYEVKQAALDQGALAVSLSGSGPSLFAWSNSKASADVIAYSMQDSFKKNKINCDYWVSRISTKGAHIINTKE